MRVVLRGFRHVDSNTFFGDDVAPALDPIAAGAQTACAKPVGGRIASPHGMSPYVAVRGVRYVAAHRRALRRVASRHTARRLASHSRPCALLRHRAAARRCPSLRCTSLPVAALHVAARRCAARRCPSRPCTSLPVSSLHVAPVASLHVAPVSSLQSSPSRPRPSRPCTSLHVSSLRVAEGELRQRRRVSGHDWLDARLARASSGLRGRARGGASVAL
jgi:hypothetical protein